jgi:3-oxoacyl-[acyl-carrier-protein] synthase-3
MAPLPEARSVAETAAPDARRTTGVLGLGTALPDEVVGNEEIAERLGVDSEWIVRRTGIHERRRAAPDARLDDLAADAARAALADANLDAEEIDQVLVATMSADNVTPNSAPVVAHLIGATRAGAMDVGAACTGALSALAAACGMIESGRAEHILVIGAEMLSRHTDHDDKRTAALFGDGAGALVVSATAEGRIGPIVLGADGGVGDLIVADRLDGNIVMNGHDTFTNAVMRLDESTRQACEADGVELADIDLFVYHQANRRILTAAAERLELPEEKVLDCIATMGNTSAASVPLGLEEARKQGMLEPGMRVLLGAVGAGFTWGAAVVEWGANEPSD